MKTIAPEYISLKYLSSNTNLIAYGKFWTLDFFIYSKSNYSILSTNNFFLFSNVLVDCDFPSDNLIICYLFLSVISIHWTQLTYDKVKCTFDTHLGHEELKVISVSVSNSNPLKSFSFDFTLNVDMKFNPKKSEESTEKML